MGNAPITAMTVFEDNQPAIVMTKILSHMVEPDILPKHLVMDSSANYVKW